TARPRTGGSTTSTCWPTPPPPSIDVDEPTTAHSPTTRRPTGGGLGSVVAADRGAVGWAGARGRLGLARSRRGPQPALGRAVGSEVHRRALVVLANHA